MICKVILSILTLFLSGAMVAQNFGPALKRTPHKLVVLVDKKTVYEEELKATPYLWTDNTLQLYPGETVFIEVEQENGIIKNMRAVEKIADSSRTLVVSLNQVAKKGKHEQTILKIYNPFSKPLVYEAKMFLLDHNQWVSTTVMPVQAKLYAFELWPNIIISMGLRNWRFEAN